MDRVEIMSEEWENNFYKIYYKNIIILIDAFVEYYGEQHRDYIGKTILDLPIRFMLNQELLSNIISKNNIEIRDLVNKLEKYFNILKRKIKLMKLLKIKNEDIEYEFVKACITEEVNKDSVLYYTYRETLRSHCCAAMYSNREEIKGIILPLFFATNESLIHELNHALCTHFINNECYAYIEAFKYIEPVELINEISALEITKIFEKKGGNLATYNHKLHILYTKKLVFAEDFYNRFKDIIKEALITGKREILTNQLGEKNFEKYLSLVIKLYHTKIVTKEDLQRLKFLTNIMELHKENKRKYEKSHTLMLM